MVTTLQKTRAKLRDNQEEIVERISANLYTSAKILIPRGSTKGTKW